MDGMPDKQESLYGAGLGLGKSLSLKYPQREASSSEMSFFSQNPHVAGYAAPDKSVVMNPKDASNEYVLFNERLRHLFSDSPELVPLDMSIHPHQVPSNQYAEDPVALRSTVLARLLSGDPSASPYSSQQYDYASKILEYLRSMGNPNATD